MAAHRGWTSLAVVAAVAPWLALQVPAGAATPQGKPAIVDSLWSAGLRDSSQALLEEWIPQARSAADSALLCRLLSRYGAHLVSFGDTRRSERALREAVLLADARGDSTTLLNAVRWLSVAVGGQGRIAEAHALYLRLREMARRRGDLRHEGWALVGLAWEASQTGRTRDSAGLSLRAARLFARAGDAQGEIWARNDLGVALSALGDFRGAAACYRRSAAVARKVDFPMIEAIALNNLGHLEYGLGDPGRALEDFRRSLGIMRRIGQQREAITPELNIAICLMDLGRLNDAGDILAQCGAECRGQGYFDLQGMALYQSAELRRMQSRKHEAAALYRRALALGPAQTLRNRVESLIGLSNVLAEVDSTSAALEAARAAVQVLGRGELREMEPLARRTLAERLLALGDVRGSLGHLLAADRAAQYSGWSGRRVGILVLAARGYRALGRPDSALALLHRAVSVWEGERQVPLDPEWREQRGATGQMLFTDLAGLVLEGASPLPPAARTAAAFDLLQRFKTRTLLERMLGPGAYGSGSAASEPERTVTLAQIQGGLLKDGDLLLDFYLGPNVSLLLAVTRNQVRAVRLPPSSELEGRLRIYQELLVSTGERTGDGAESARSARASAAREISRLLFGEIEELFLASRRVIVSADGALNLLPLVELPGPDGEPRLQGRQWIRVPSATVLLRIAGRPAPAPHGGGASILALAGVERLPGVEREVAELRRTFRDVQTALAAEDSPEDPGGLSTFRLLHFASHLDTDDQHPWQSRLRLNAGDSTLTLDAATLAQLHLSARMAVLSSCSSAGGRILSGEGVLGFSSALLSAGVPTVVASLWPVDDGATVLFMRIFYGELARRANAAEALRNTQAVLRSRPATREPRHWAGFVVIGDGDVRVPLQRRGPGFLASGSALILLGLLLGGLALRGLRPRPR
jgi:tetratricopeptide (TPR) repeat protein